MEKEQVLWDIKATATVYSRIDSCSPEEAIASFRKNWAEEKLMVSAGAFECIANPAPPYNAVETVKAALDEIANGDLL